MKQLECTTVIHVPGHLPEHVRLRAVLSPGGGTRTTTLIEFHFEGGLEPTLETSETTFGSCIRLTVHGTLEREGLVAALHALSRELLKT